MLLNFDFRQVTTIFSVVNNACDFGYFYPGGYFLVKDYWGCAAGWGRIFTTGMTIMGLHF